jgi:hypothetical protein
LRGWARGIACVFADGVGYVPEIVTNVWNGSTYSD